MSIERLARNFLKMTPGSLAGDAKSATPVKSDTLGALRRIPAGTFGGESRVATPIGCNRPAHRVTDQTEGPAECFQAELVSTTGGGDTRIEMRWVVTVESGCGVEIDDLGGSEFITATLPDGCFIITAALVYADEEGPVTVEVSDGDSVWGSNTDPGTSVLNVEVPEGQVGQLIVFDAEGSFYPVSGTLTVCCGTECPETPVADRMITEDGDYMITEDGDYMIPEGP